MERLIRTITSYNLVNYLLPGFLFVIYVESFTEYSLWQENLIAGFFLYYFIGMIISRVGSLIVEPFLRWVGFLEKVDYKLFVRAEVEDGKVGVLSEQNNQYRTVVALFLVIGFLEVWEFFCEGIISTEAQIFTLFAALFILFLVSYEKQTGYVVKRVKGYVKK